MEIVEPVVQIVAVAFTDRRDLVLLVSMEVDLVAAVVQLVSMAVIHLDAELVVIPTFNLFPSYTLR